MNDPRAGDPGFLTLSNMLSLSRIPLGVSLLSVSNTHWLAAIVALAALTDLLDGMIARLSDTVSGVGVLLDPFCDKLFVLLGLVSFLPGPYLDWAAFLILILRDIFTAGTYLLGQLAGLAVPFRSRFAGKLTTALQIATLFILVFWPAYVAALVLLTGLASVWAILDYGVAGLRVDGEPMTL